MWIKKKKKTQISLIFFLSLSLFCSSPFPTGWHVQWLVVQQQIDWADFFRLSFSSVNTSLLAHFSDDQTSTTAICLFPSAIRTSSNRDIDESQKAFCFFLQNKWVLFFFVMDFNCNNNRVTFFFPVSWEKKLRDKERADERQKLWGRWWGKK